MTNHEFFRDIRPNKEDYRSLIECYPASKMEALFESLKGKASTVKQGRLRDKDLTDTEAPRPKPPKKRKLSAKERAENSKGFDSDTGEIFSNNEILDRAQREAEEIEDSGEERREGSEEEGDDEADDPVLDVEGELEESDKDSRPPKKKRKKGREGEAPQEAKESPSTKIETSDPTEKRSGEVSKGGKTKAKDRGKATKNKPDAGEDDKSVTPKKAPKKKDRRETQQAEDEEASEIDKTTRAEKKAAKGDPRSFLDF